MKQLHETQPHFVRCIVPNLTKSSNIIDTKLVLNQLQCNGVLEGIRIARKGFPNRLTFAEFRRRFEILTPGLLPKGTFIEGGLACEKILRELELESSLYKRGRTKIFFKAGILARLEERLDEYLSAVVTKLQCLCRGVIARRRASKDLNRAAAINTIQRNARIYIELQKWPWWPLFQKVRPMLAAARNDDELRRQAAELVERREQAEKETQERIRLMKVSEALEVERVRIEAALAGEVAANLEKESALVRVSQRVGELEGELEGMGKDLELVELELARALAAKVDVESRAGASLADSNRLIDSLRTEQKAWKAREIELLDKTSINTTELESLVSERDRYRSEVDSLGRRLKDSSEDSKRTKERLSDEVSNLSQKLESQTFDATESRKKLLLLEKEGRSFGEEISTLQRENKENLSRATTMDSELKRLTSGSFIAPLCIVLY